MNDLQKEFRAAAQQYAQQLEEQNNPDRTPNNELFAQHLEQQLAELRKSNPFHQN